MGRGKKIDTNHVEIREGMRRVGIPVFDIHTLPGALDLMAQTRTGRLVLLEVKSGVNEPLTSKEAETFNLFAGNCYRVMTIQQAIDICRDEED